MLLIKYGITNILELLILVFLGVEGSKEDSNLTISPMNYDYLFACIFKKIFRWEEYLMLNLVNFATAYHV